MNREDFVQQYKDKSNLELVLIAENYDQGYTGEAVKAATRVLLSRYVGTTNLETIFQKEFSQLLELSEKCSICQNSDVVYSEDFYLCTVSQLDIPRSIPGILASTLIGFGYTKEKYNAIKLEFRLCSDCLEKRKSTDTEIVGLQDYYRHPLYNLYRHFGFTEVSRSV